MYIDGLDGSGCELGKIWMESYLINKETGIELGWIYHPWWWAHSEI